MRRSLGKGTVAKATVVARPLATLQRSRTESAARAKAAPWPRSGPRYRIAACADPPSDARRIPEGDGVVGDIGCHDGSGAHQSAGANAHAADDGRIRADGGAASHQRRLVRRLAG